MDINRNLFRIFGQLFFSYAVLLVSFLALLVLTSLIPSPLLSNNVGDSVATLKKEGLYPSFGLPGRQIVLDNFTDSLMLNTAYSVNSRYPIWSALMNVRSDGVADGDNQVLNLEKLYAKGLVIPVNYERYWHGYLILIRPLLTLFSYETIRVILTTLLYTSLIVFVYYAWKKLDKVVTFAVLIGLLATDFFYLGQSIQFSGVYLVGLIGSIYLLRNYQKGQWLYNFFFVIGALTSYFDLLTAPMVTVGLISSVTISLEKRSIKNMLLLLTVWTVGYGSLWFSKWLIVQLFFSPGAIQTAFDQVVNRTSAVSDVNFSYLKIIQLNLFQLIGYSKMSRVTVSAIVLVTSIFILKYRKFNRTQVTKIAPLLLIAVVPYLWYLVAANHSYLHVWYTYRSQFGSVAAGVLIASEVVDWTRVRRDLDLFKRRFWS